jgi:hypothetical protein
MARVFNNAGILSRTTNPPVTNTNTTVTLAGWFIPTTSTSQGVLFQAGDTVNSNFWRLIFDASINTAAGHVQQAGVGESFGVGATLTVGVWHHLCLVVTSATVRHVFYNGGSKTAGNGVSYQPATVTHTAVGGIWSGGNPTVFCDATLADLACWDVVLTDEEVAALGRGVSPALIRPADLVAFWPLDSGSGDGYLQNRVRDGASYALTLTATAPAAAPHPPTMPAFNFWREYVPAPAPSVTFDLLRPNADSSDGSWTNQSGNQTNLFASIDEVTADDDTTYIRSVVSPAGDVCKIAFGDPPGGVTTPMRIRYRYRKNTGGGAINLQVRLLQGTTSVWSTTHNDISSGYVTADTSITPSPVITDATDLFIEFTATKV